MGDTACANPTWRVLPYSLITEKPVTCKWKKELKGWLDASLKSTETRDELSTTCNPKVMSRCLSVPDATSLHHCLQNHRQYCTILSWIQALDTKRPVASLGKRDLLGSMQVLATPSSTVNKTKNLEPYNRNHISFSCLFLRQWCRDVASGTDRHLDITSGLQVAQSSSLVSVLFSHPYISYFHLLVNGFSVTCMPPFLSKWQI